MTKQNLFFTAGLALSLTTATWAQQATRTIADPSTLVGARSAGRAGATVASPGLSQDSLFLNPASAAFKDTYAVTGAYKGQGSSLIASVVDSKTGPVGGGLYYARRDFNDASSLVTPGLGSTRRIEDRAGGSLFGKLSEEFAVGVVGKWGRFTSKERSVTSFKKWNFSVGATYAMNRDFSFGVVGENLLKDDQGLDVMRFVGGAEARVIQGLSLSAQIFRVASAPSGAVFSYPNTNAKLGWAAGAEFAFNDAFAVRGGYKDNPTWNEITIGAGATYSGKSFALDYAFEVLTEQDNQQYHSVGVTALF